MRWHTIIFGAALLAAAASAQNTHTLHAHRVPAGAGVERVAIGLGVIGKEPAEIEARPWPASRASWMFCRTGDRQENRHHPEAGPDGAIAFDLAPAGASIVGVELDPVIETSPPARWRAFAERALPEDPLPEQNGGVRIRRRESLVAIIRPEDDTSGPSPIATSKLGMRAEIRPLMDPTRPGFSGDMAFRVYLSGVSVANQRVLATHVDSGERRTIVTREGGFGDLRLDRTGDWRIEFHRAEPSPAPDADLAVISGVLTFTVRGGAK